MRIFQISNGIYPLSQAGTEIYTAEIARAMEAAGLQVRVAVPGTPKVNQADREGRLPAFVVPVPLAPGGRLGNKLRYLTGRGPLWADRLSQIVCAMRPDLIHVHHAEGFGISALEVAAGWGLPLVITLPDYWLLCPGLLRHCGGNLSRCAKECCASLRISKLPERIAVSRLSARLKRIRRIVDRARPALAAISDATRRTFEGAGFDKSRLVTHTWGINAHSFRATNGEQHEGPPRIAYLGTMRPHKGCHVLLDAYKRLDRPASLHFYGGGDDRYIGELREQAAGLNVHFHGRFDHATVANVLGEVDVVVVPSIWEETYCLVAQEAMAARRPVVATRVGGLADRIEHGINGFLVSPNDPAGLALQLADLVDRLPQMTATLDFDRCAVSLEDDVKGWTSLYEKTIADWRSRN